MTKPMYLAIGFFAGLACGICLDAGMAHAADSHCSPLADVKLMMSEKSGRVVEFTHDQFVFLEGIYAMNPNTPPGLPPGNKAILAQVGGDPNGVVMFVDGDNACWPMPVPKELLDMLNDVATGVANHEGAKS